MYDNVAVLKALNFTHSSFDVNVISKILLSHHLDSQITQGHMTSEFRLPHTYRVPTATHL